MWLIYYIGVGFYLLRSAIRKNFENSSSIELGLMYPPMADELDDSCILRSTLVINISIIIESSLLSYFSMPYIHNTTYSLDEYGRHCMRWFNYHTEKCTQKMIEYPQRIELKSKDLRLKGLCFVWNSSVRWAVRVSVCMFVVWLFLILQTSFYR